MQKLYCPKCGEYLMCGTGDCIDCHCGWKQKSDKDEEDEDEV